MKTGWNLAGKERTDLRFEAWAHLKKMAIEPEIIFLQIFRFSANNFDGMEEYRISSFSQNECKKGSIMYDPTFRMDQLQLQYIQFFNSISGQNDLLFHKLILLPDKMKVISDWYVTLYNVAA
jgi:hypothetical protein